MVQEIVSLITDIGFPFAVCLICFWYINNQNERATERELKQEEKHTSQVKLLSESLNNNTDCVNEMRLLIQKILDKLEVNKNG